MGNVVPVLAIDGPSGSGKGTIGQKCAYHLVWHYLDSGAIYRGLAWLASQQGIDADEVAALTSLASEMKLVCHVRHNDSAEIEINDKVVTEQLRTEEIAEIASKIAPLKPVREALLVMQRGCLTAPGLVADGRDMATVVFPDAPYKVFLTASAKVRAQRRFEQLKSKGFDVSLARLLESIQARDVRDSEREASPLLAAQDALLIDTSLLTIDQVVARVLDLIKQD